jgi:D-alanine-D-alanine ligase
VIRDVEVRGAGAKGRGVYARRAFAEGEFIFRRRHACVLRATDLPALSEWQRDHLCELGFDRFAVLAPPGCYLNHSCDPNAMRHGVKVFAWRPISKGAEITIDYRLNAFEDGSSWPCECGAANAHPDNPTDDPVEDRLRSWSERVASAPGHPWARRSPSAGARARQ